MIKYSLPGAFELFHINEYMLEIYNVHREYFYDDVEIEAVYGNPQFCIWDGGRIFQNSQYISSNKVTERINIYNKKFNIPIRYIFTNHLLQPSDYLDRWGNILLSLGQSYPNQVVVADDVFAQYIKTGYDNYSFISSTTKCLVDDELQRLELDKDLYSEVCLDYNHNFDFDFLEALTESQKKKTEILINPICRLGCAYRKDHYKFNSISNKNYNQGYRMENCMIRDNTFNHPPQKLSYEDLQIKYAPLGFEHFKIEGRTWDAYTVLLTYNEYMIKPKYTNLVLAAALEKIMKEA